MPQDAFTLRVVSKELNDRLKGAKINKITMPCADLINMVVFTGVKTEKLVISASVSSARVSLNDGDGENPLTAFNFCMLLRKHLLGGEIVSVSQVDYERIIAITITNEEFFGKKEYILYAEVMGKYSNAVLTENGVILGAVKQAGIDSATRPIMTGLKYTFPAKQDKISPYSDGFIDYITAFNGGDLASYLFNGVSGFAYSTATELCVKFFGKTTVETVSKDRLTDFANYIITTVNSPKTTPTVKVDGNTVIDFFAFDYSTVAGESKTFDSVLSAQSYFYSVKESSAKLKMQENKLLQSLNAYEKKLKKRLLVIEEKERDCANIEDLKIKGELLIAYAYKIPVGVSEVVLENYYNDNKPIKITLDKTLKPTANAEKYFKRYAKQKRTLDAVLPQKEEVLLELNYLDSVLEEIKLCENSEEYSFIERELIESGIIKKELPKKNKREKESNREYNIDGFTVFVGRNNAENDRLVKDARGKDIWFHAKKYHSSHAIVCIREKPITQKVIYAVAEIVAYYSAGRGGTKIEVDYTEKRFVKKPPKAKSGFVIYTDFKSVTVNPFKHEEFLKSK